MANRVNTVTPARWDYSPAANRICVSPARPGQRRPREPQRRQRTEIRRRLPLGLQSGLGVGLRPLLYPVLILILIVIVIFFCPVSALLHLGRWFVFSFLRPPRRPSPGPRPRFGRARGGS